MVDKAQTAGTTTPNRGINLIGLFGVITAALNDFKYFYKHHDSYLEDISYGEK